MTRESNIRDRPSVVLLAVILFSCLSAWAADITAKQAETAVGNWAKRSPSPLEAKIGHTVRAAQTYTSDAGEPLFHVVRFEEGGFVVTSADDGITPIIAFSGNDDLVVDAQNPFWVMLNKDLPQRKLQAKARQTMQQLQGLAAQAEVGTPEAEWASLLAEQVGTLGLSSVSDERVTPFVQSRWSQSTVNGYNTYNYYTPFNYVCGCVATAGAQIMLYHQYPSGSVSAGTYTCFVNGTASSKTMQGGTYAWASMPTVPDASITLAQRQAIGKLTSDVGIACYMQYDSDGSGALDMNLAKAFTGRFTYARSVIILDNNGVDSYYSKAVLANLDAGYPVAFGISGTGGHEVVGDGYGYTSSTLYIHLNMGWAGSDDAWYNLPTVNPALNSQYTFTIVKSIVYNIFPTHTGEIISGRVLNAAGSPVSGASVVAVNETTSTTLAAVTSNARGIYAILVPEPTSPATHSYRLTATSGSQTGVQTTTITASTSTHTTYTESTGAGLYYPGTGAVGNQWGVNLTVTSASAPAAPTGVSADDGTSTASVPVAWTLASGATGYGVYRYTSNSSASASLLGGAAGTTYADSTATPGTLYYYWVKATNSAGASAFSASDSGYRALSAPAGVSATDAAQDKVSVTWSTVTGALCYRVYRAASSGGAKTALSSWQTALSYDDTSAVAGTTNYYWVAAAVDNAGARASAYSAYDTGLRLAASIPPTPAGVSADDGTSTASVPVAWTLASGATGYGVYRYTSNSSASASLLGGAAGTTYADSTATPGALYFYWVKATNSAGASAFSASDSGYRALSAPAGVSATDTAEDKVSVTWSAVTGASFYKVYRATSSGGTKTALGTWQSVQSYDDTSAVTGTTYYYWVVAAVDNAGTRASAYSAYDAGLRVVPSLTLAAALDTTGLTWTTGGNTTWAGETTTTYDGVDAAQSGDVADSQSTWVETTVTGPGTISFKWSVSSESGFDKLYFKTNGVSVSYISGTVGWTNGTSAVAAGAHTLRWSFAKDNNSSAGSDCGWLDQVVWTPSSGSTSTTSVPVPYTWLETYRLVSGGNYEAAALADADGDGYLTWQEYVAGTVPTNRHSVFMAAVSFSNGVRSVTWTPNLGGARVYTVEGKAALGEASWSSSTNATTRFFRVKVSMP